MEVPELNCACGFMACQSEPIGATRSFGARSRRLDMTRLAARFMHVLSLPSNPSKKAGRNRLLMGRSNFSVTIKLTNPNEWQFFLVEVALVELSIYFNGQSAVVSSSGWECQKSSAPVPPYFIFVNLFQRSPEITMLTDVLSCTFCDLCIILRKN